MEHILIDLLHDEVAPYLISMQHGEDAAARADVRQCAVVQAAQHLEHMFGSEEGEGRAILENVLPQAVLNHEDGLPSDDYCLYGLAVAEVRHLHFVGEGEDEEWDVYDEGGVYVVNSPRRSVGLDVGHQALRVEPEV